MVCFCNFKKFHPEKVISNLKPNFAHLTSLLWSIRGLVYCTDRYLAISSQWPDGQNYIVAELRYGKYRIKKTRCEQSLGYISRRLLRCIEKTFTTANPNPYNNCKSSVKNGQRLKNLKNRFPDLLKSASQNCAVSEFISTVLHLLWKKEIKISELSIISLPPFKNLWKFKVALNSLYKIFWNSLNLIKLITIRLNNGGLRGCL